MEIMIGQTIESIEQNDEQIIFNCEHDAFASEHYQDCCESVGVVETHGNLEDIIGSPVISANESYPDLGDLPNWASQYQPYDSYTFTLQTIRTAKGEVSFLWLGESNGYYGEQPYFRRTHKKI